MSADGAAGAGGEAGPAEQGGTPEPASRREPDSGAASDGWLAPDSEEPRRTAAEQPGPKASAREPDGAAEEKDQTAIEDDFEAALSPEEFRRQQAEIRSIRAASFGGVGAAAFGSGDAVGRDKIVISHGAGRDRCWQVRHYTEKEVKDRDARVVDVPAVRHLAELLGERPVAVLSGKPRTGRTTAALAALARHTTRIGLVQGQHPPAELTDEIIEPGAGYIFDTTGAAWARRLLPPAVLGCERTLRRLHARLVVVVSEDCEIEAVAELAVRHLPPDPRAVLERYLLADLPETPEKSEVIEKVLKVQAVPRNPAAAADLARAMVSGLERGDTIEAVLAGRPDPMRADALTLLRQRGDGPPEERDLARRAFVIAWSVLNGLPAVQVCRAAQRLAVLLYRIESPKIDTKLSQLPFGCDLETWLRYVDEADGDALGDDDRRLLLRRREGFDMAIFDVVWFDYIVAHEALLSWLSDLAADPDRRIRAKVSIALGRLAAHDFDFIAQRCFVDWSLDAGQPLQEVTAWALGEVTKHRPELKERVFALADAWAGGNSAPRRLTAVRLYGAHLGVLDPMRAMGGLRRVTLKDARRLHRAIIWSVVEIFAEGRGEVVTRALGDWAASPQPAVSWMAAECLAELARLTDARDRPQLLALYEREPEPVVALWQRVLTSPFCGGRPWDALRAWPESGFDIKGLRSRLERDHTLRRPLDFYLGAVAGPTEHPPTDSFEAAI